jgi:hypothetical protein
LCIAGATIGRPTRYETYFFLAKTPGAAKTLYRVFYSHFIGVETVRPQVRSHRNRCGVVCQSAPAPMHTP